MDNVINNPMAQLARMYQHVENVMRRAAADDKPKTIPEVRAIPEIAELERSPWQVRDILATLEKKGHVIKGGGGRSHNYKWDLSSPPFVLHARHRERIMTDPSEPDVETYSPPATQERRATPVTTQPTLQNKEVEFVFHGVEFVVGINPKTGNLRLKIEKE